MLEADISESDAIDIAHNYVSDQCEVATCELTYVDPQHYNFDNSNYQKGHCYLAYKVLFDEGVEVIVNAVNGCVIGFDQLLLEEARNYTIEESIDESDYWGYRDDVTSQ